VGALGNNAVLTGAQIRNILLSESQNKFHEVSAVLVEMRARSQITLPSEITKKIGIQEGDRFEVMERDGGVFLCPVVVYPKNKLEKVAKTIKDHEKEPSVVYSSVEDMFNDLGISLGDYDVQP
jgi:AbrB family looped-hinge helix DNA binding protein